jgi:hypothetical protein
MINPRRGDVVLVLCPKSIEPRSGVRISEPALPRFVILTREEEEGEATSDRLSAGRASQTLMISSVVLPMAIQWPQTEKTSSRFGLDLLVDPLIPLWRDRARMSGTQNESLDNLLQLAGGPA